MIIEALVRIELKSDGTWQICDLKPVTDTKLPEEQPQKPKPGVIESHFENRDRVRKKRALEKNPRGPRIPEIVKLIHTAVYNRFFLNSDFLCSG